MPRQNRVAPDGEIVAVPERGTFMGNRGILHNAQGQIVRPWANKRWLICLLQFKGRHRQVMAPDRYTELFFLDEATALSAGHRPCFECRRQRYLAFQVAWTAGNLLPGEPQLSTTELDARLHAERVGLYRSHTIFVTDLDDLPDGVFVQLDRPCLVRGEFLLPWSAGGYVERQERPRGVRASVLTPRSTVAAIRAGYVPELHESAG
jgi:hypothetical protein